MDVASGHGGFDRETLGDPRSNLVAARPAVQSGPYEGGSRIQLVNTPTRSIEDHDFTLDVSYREAGPGL